jgi:DNA polymerase-4
MSTLIMHVDMDAFFATVEELADPSLKGKPIVVAGPGDRSIVTTASYRARSFGIRTGMTSGQARSLCGDLIVLKADYRKYAHASGMVMETLESFTPMVDILSVDEAFLDISDLPLGPGEQELLGRKVKDKVRKATGLTCSVGIAPGRLLAKLASTLDKPDGLTVIRADGISEVLEKLPVGKLCGIGPVTTDKLQEMGIKTCGQLGRYPLEPLEKKFGIMGKNLSLMGKGKDPPGNPILGGNTGNARSVGHSVTLPRDLTDRDDMKRVLLTLSEMVGRRIRRHSGAAGTLTVTWRYDDFSTFTRQKSLASHVRLTKEIYDQALSIFDRTEFTRPVRLLGISLSRLSFENMPLYHLLEDQRNTRLQDTLDSVNDRYGEFSLAFAGSMRDLRNLKVISPAWRSKGIKNSF